MLLFLEFPPMCQDFFLLLWGPAYFILDIYSIVDMGRDRRRGISVPYVYFFLYFTCLQFGFISLLIVSVHTVCTHIYNGNMKMSSCLALLKVHLTSKGLINKPKLQREFSLISDSCSVSKYRTLFSTLVSLQAFRVVLRWICLSSFQS